MKELVQFEAEVITLKAKRIPFSDLCDRLAKLESKHGCSTIEFYERYRRGQCGHDDEFMTWAGLYHLYLTSLPVRQFMQQALKSA